MRGDIFELDRCPACGSEGGKSFEKEWYDCDLCERIVHRSEEPVSDSQLAKECFLEEASKPVPPGRSSSSGPKREKPKPSRRRSWLGDDFEAFEREERRQDRGKPKRAFLKLRLPKNGKFSRQKVAEILDRADV